MKRNLFVAKLAEYQRVKMLSYPTAEKIDVVLDTDAATEVDDQFAISHFLSSPERIELKAIYAAPFAMNEKTKDPAVGMEMSYQEIYKIARLMKNDFSAVYRGSKEYLKSFDAPVDSEAKDHLVQLAKSYTWENPLYVACIGAITNVASAILSDPEIVNRIVVVWLGGDDFYYTPNVYNVYQDVKAAQVIFDSGVPLVHVPCNYVSSHLLTSVPELHACLGNRNGLCNYLIEVVENYGSNHFAWGKQIWDIAVSGYFMNAGYAKTELTPAPMITDELTYSFDGSRHLIAKVTSLRRDSIFRDLFTKIGNIW